MRVPPDIDYIVAPSRMQIYIEYSVAIYEMNGICIRDWTPEHEKIDKGIILLENKLSKLKSLQ